MKKFFTIAFAVLFPAAVVLAQTTAQNQNTTPVKTKSTAGKAKSNADKTTDIKTLLTLTKSGELAVSMMQEMINVYRQNLPQVPEEFWTGFARKVKTDDLMEMLVPIYDRHLTHTEVTSLIEFFQSPVGKKLVSVQPEIMKESMQVGQKWGEKLGNEVVAELQKQGYR